MNRLIAIIILITCACINLQAQVNLVKNPGLEEYSKCPTDWNQITYANFWTTPIDSLSTLEYQMEYYNRCAGSNRYGGLPSNISFYQNTHSGDGMGGAILYYDKTTPYPAGAIPHNYRDYLQGRLYNNLLAGKDYCVSFYINLTEASGYANNKIGAFLDDGSFDDTVSVPGSEMTFVVPQVYTNTVIDDTANWIKIEGSFKAKGNERYITIGNFFKNEDLTTVVTNYWAAFVQYSYYLIDDISVIPLDLAANAGPDTWVPKGDSVLIGRTDTAQGLDCKWYHKGTLIDSGAAIWAKGYGWVGDKDTYSVVQTICGIVKTDTVVVYTASVGINELDNDKQFSIFPNPSNGRFTVNSNSSQSQITATVLDLVGRPVWRDQVSLSNGRGGINLTLPLGVYMLSIRDANGTSEQIKLTISP